MHQAIVYARIGTLTAGGDPPDFMINDNPEIDFVGADDSSRGGKGGSHSIPVRRMNMGGQILESNARRSRDAPKVKRPVVHRQVVGIDVPSPKGYARCLNRQLQMFETNYVF
jgi:hypothetical protein